MEQKNKIRLTETDLRSIYKRETGEQFGSPINDSKRDSAMWYRDEYVEWLERTLLKHVNRE